MQEWSTEVMSKKHRHLNVLLDEIKSSYGIDLWVAAADHHKAPVDFLILAASHYDSAVREAAVFNYGMSEKALLRLLDHKRVDVRAAACSHQNATEAVIAKGIRDSSYVVRKSAAGSGYVSTNEVLLTALKDKKFEVRQAAIDNDDFCGDALPLSKEEWLNLLKQGHFDYRIAKIPLRVRRTPEYKAIRLLSKMAKE